MSAISYQCDVLGHCSCCTAENREIVAGTYFVIPSEARNLGRTYSVEGRFRFLGARSGGLLGMTYSEARSVRGVGHDGAIEEDYWESAIGLQLSV